MLYGERQVVNSFKSRNKNGQNATWKNLYQLKGPNSKIICLANRIGDNVRYNY